jgi:hypothetical protein
VEDALLSLDIEEITRSVKDINTLLNKIMEKTSLDLPKAVKFCGYREKTADVFSSSKMQFLLNNQGLSTGVINMYRTISIVDAQAKL